MAYVSVMQPSAVPCHPYVGSGGGGRNFYVGASSYWNTTPMGTTNSLSSLLPQRHSYNDEQQQQHTKSNRNSPYLTRYPITTSAATNFSYYNNNNPNPNTCNSSSSIQQGTSPISRLSSAPIGLSSVLDRGEERRYTQRAASPVNASGRPQRMERTPSMNREPNQCMLPPQQYQFSQRLVVILDLDETLVYAREGPVVLRPGCAMLLQTLQEIGAEVIVWTAGERDYAQDVIRRIDTHRVVQHCIYRHEKWWTGRPGYCKDIRVISRPMERLLFVDNTSDCLRGNQDNSILVSDFTHQDVHDDVLYLLAQVIREIDASGLAVPIALSRNDKILQRTVQSEVHGRYNVFSLQADRAIEGVPVLNRDLLAPQPTQRNSHSNMYASSLHAHPAGRTHTSSPQRRGYAEMNFHQSTPPHKEEGCPSNSPQKYSSYTSQRPTTARHSFYEDAMNDINTTNGSSTAPRMHLGSRIDLYPGSPIPSMRTNTNNNNINTSEWYGNSPNARGGERGMTLHSDPLRNGTDSSFLNRRYA